MRTTWYKGMTDREKEEIISSFNASGRLRSRMKEILEEKLISMYAKRREETSYECPNWAFKQADYVGYERAMHEILSLIDSDGISS